MSENLWPSFTLPPKPPTIRQTLIDSGKALAVQTDGKLKFQVRTLPHARGKWLHDVFLVAESLKYNYPLFRVEERGDPYPVTVVDEGCMPAANESELKESLRRFFHSSTTKHFVE